MKHYAYAFILATTLSFYGCQHDNFFSSYETDPEAVHVNAIIKAAGVPSTKVNTEGTGTTWETGDQIIVYNDKERANHTPNTASYTYTSNSWNLTNSSYMVWGTGVNNFTAHYPVDARGTSYSSFVIPKDQTSLEKLKSADWMTAELSTEKASSISLTFHHQLCKVTVVVTKDDEHATNDLSAPIFHIPSTLTKVSGKTVSVEGNSKEIQALNLTVSSTNEFIAILPAGQFTVDDTFLTFNAGATPYTAKAKATALTQGLQGGKAYKFTISVGDKSALIGDVTVNDWGTEQSIGNGSAAQEALDVTGKTLNNQILTDATFNNSLVISGNFSEGNTDPNFKTLVQYMQTNNIKVADLGGVTGITLVKPFSGEHFSGMTSLERIILPQTVETIGTYAFSGCSNLKAVKGDGVRTIEEQAFPNCPNLTITYFPQLNTIGSGAFTNSGLIEFLNSSVNHIGDQAFSDCASLTNINCPGVTEIEANAFYNCTTLPFASFPKANTLGARVFQNCKKLTEIRLESASFTNVDANVFSDIHTEAGKPNLYLHADQKNKIQVSGNSCSWAPYEGGNITDFSHIGKIFCGTEQVYPVLN